MSILTLKKGLEIELCTEIGKRAFREGKKCIPAKDENIMSLIANTDKRSITTIQALKAWIAGWTQANLEA